jgi:hypothetical protein
MVRRKNYTQKSNDNKMLFGFILIALAIFGGLAFFSASDSSSEKDVELLTQATQSDFCSNNPKLDLDIRIKDLLSSTGAYINGSTIYVTDMDSGATVEYVVAGGTTGSFDTETDALRCGDAFAEGVAYIINIKGTGDYSSDGTIELSKSDLYEDPVPLTFGSTLYTPFKVKGYDEDAKSKIYTSANSTDYVTSLTSTFYYSTSSTAWTIGADGSLDVTFTLAPNSSSETKGEAIYVAVDLADDSNLDDWDVDTLEVTYDGVTLSQATLSENEGKALQTYDAVYLIENPIGMKGSAKDSEVDMRVQVTSGDAINPDFDPVIKIVALGDFKSTKSDEVLEGVGFQDSSARTELYTAQTITLSVD